MSGRHVKIIGTAEYFHKEVDPVVRKCVTFLMHKRPVNVPLALIDFLTNPDDLQIDKEYMIKTERDQKNYFYEEVHPIIKILVDNVALKRQDNVELYFCDQLKTMSKIS